MKEEIKKYSELLASSKREVTDLSEKVREQEREISQSHVLKEQSDTHHTFTSQQIPTKQLTEEEREYQIQALRRSMILLTLTLKLVKAEKEKRQHSIKKASAQDTMFYCKREQDVLEKCKRAIIDVSYNYQYYNNCM